MRNLTNLSINWRFATNGVHIRNLIFTKHKEVTLMSYKNENEIMLSCDDMRSYEMINRECILYDPCKIDDKDFLTDVQVTAAHLASKNSLLEAISSYITIHGAVPFGEDCYLLEQLAELINNSRLIDTIRLLYNSHPKTSDETIRDIRLINSICHRRLIFHSQVTG